MTRIALVALAAVPVTLPATAAGAAELPPPPEFSAVPIPAGQIDAAVAKLDSIAADAMSRSGVPGMSIAVVHGDEVVYARGFGVRSVRTREPVDPDTVFQLASLSKPVGATVVARAVGEGIVGWDDRMRERLPWFALGRATTNRELTIADLYSHRSGLPGHGGDLLEDLGFGRRAILRRLRLLPLTPIRTAYAYTNFGLTAAAMAVARSARADWAALSQRMLYRPLAMRSTSSRYRDYLRAPNRAVLHRVVDGRWVTSRRDPEGQSPAGGVSSSASDMAKWLRLQLAGGMLDGRQILDAGPLTAMLTPHSVSGLPRTPSSRPSYYGLGIGIGADSAGRMRFSHSGAFAMGAATAVAWVPSADLGVVVLTNGKPMGVPESVVASFLDLAEIGEIERDWLSAYAPVFAAMEHNPSRLAGRRRPARPRPARPARAYLGSYGNAYVGGARVVRRRGRLTLLLGPRPQAFRLRHWSGDTFSWEPRGENAVGISAVTFRGGRAGRARAIVVEYLDQNGLGRLTRR